MKFHIEKIYLWFGPDEKRCISFENNKVNVVRGNSSRGKSNLFAIIDYCLMSDKPNIVEPVINECTIAYGMEFVLNDTYYAVSRMKPESGTASQCVWLQHEPFKEGYYPNGSSNIKPFDLRRKLDFKCKCFAIKTFSYTLKSLNRRIFWKVRAMPILAISLGRLPVIFTGSPPGAV